MRARLPKEVEALEAQVAAEPESEALQDALLFAYLAHNDLQGDPRRIARIRDFVVRFPRALTCRTPVVDIYPEASPDGFRIVEAAWLRLVKDHPGDVDIAVHAALFIANADRGRALDLVRPIVDADPSRGDVWFQMGRIALEPGNRLAFFRKARAHGSRNPNLEVWIACAEARVGDFDAARASARGLLARAEDARVVYGEPLGWRDRGADLWARANARCADRDTATRLIRAIGDHAGNTHWGHTVMGLVAAHDGDLAAAADHLRRSGDVVGNSRLRSYGPAMTLAGVLCRHGKWAEVAAYLAACSLFWSDPRLTRWRAQVDRHAPPDFPVEG